MTKPNSTLTAERVRELLHYDAETGVFTWRISVGRHGRIKAGVIAGSLTEESYIRIHIDRDGHRAHRLVWLYVYGKWPVNEIDHINGIRNDNRLCNLRNATKSENLQNQRKAQSDNKTGLLGVCFAKSTGKFVATICVNGKNRTIGRFNTNAEAHDAYIAAKRIHHPFGTVASNNL